MIAFFAERRIGIKLIYLLLLMIFVLQIIALIGGISSRFADTFVPLLSYFTYIYITLTYLVISILIKIESKTLEEFHFDRFTVATFVVASLIRQKAGVPGEGFFLFLIMLAGVFIVFTLIREKPNIPRTQIRWVLLGIGVSVLAIVVTTLFELNMRNSWEIMQLDRNSMFSTVSGEVIRQWSFGALIEEIVFRGFLWGYLRRKGWNETQTVWVQGIMFWFLHISKIVTPFTFFIVIPMITVIFSKLTLRSRQIYPSLIAHTIINVLSTTLNLFVY